MNYRQLLTQVLERYEDIKHIKFSLEIDEAKGYPTDEDITYILTIKRNNDLIYKDTFCKNKLRDIDGEEEVCLRVISDIMYYGLDRIERDFDE